MIGHAIRRNEYLGICNNNNNKKSTQEDIWNWFETLDMEGVLFQSSEIPSFPEHWKRLLTLQRSIKQTLSTKKSGGIRKWQRGKNSYVWIG